MSTSGRKQTSRGEPPSATPRCPGDWTTNASPASFLAICPGAQMPEDAVRVQAAAARGYKSVSVLLQKGGARERGRLCVATASPCSAHTVGYQKMWSSNQIKLNRSRIDSNTGCMDKCQNRSRTGELASCGSSRVHPLEPLLLLPLPFPWSLSYPPLPPAPPPPCLRPPPPPCWQNATPSRTIDPTSSHIA